MGEWISLKLSDPASTSLLQEHIECFSLKISQSDLDYYLIQCDCFFEIVVAYNFSTSGTVVCRKNGREL